MFDTLWQDVRYAARSLVRRPLVTIVAVLSLALGIGVNTAIFSVFERLLLRELPVPAPHELVNVISPGPKPGSRSTGNSGGLDEIFSYPLFRDLEKLEATGLSRIAAHREFAVNLAHDGRTERADGLLVSGGYFPALGVRPALGRLLTPDDDRVTGGHPLVVLAHDYWTSRLGADPNILGRALTVNGQLLTVGGVAPAGFGGTTTMDAPQVFVPLAMGPQVAGLSEERNNHSLYLFARLQPGTTLERAQAAINGPFTGIIRDVEFPVQRRGMGDRGREQFLARQIVLIEGARGRNSGRREATLILGLMLTVTGLVLLIACANVANLLLARAADRTGEMAVRLSIGGSSRRLLRLLLVEAMLLGVLGAAGALAVGKATSVTLLNRLPADDAQVFQFVFNTPLVLFTLLLGFGAAMLFGIYPAVQSVRDGVLASRTNSGRTSQSRSAAWFRTSLATGQIALATVLLALAGLFLTSLVNIGREELGLRREGLIGFRLSPYLNGYTPERALALFDRIEDELRESPGVISVAATTVPLLADADQGQNVTVEGFNAGPDDNTQASFGRTGTDYFRTLGIPLLAGREFSRADGADGPKVAIVNEAFARKFGLGADAVGTRMALGAGGQNFVLDIEIVGLVRDAKYSEVREPAPPQFFLPYRQGGFGSLTFYARAAGDANQLRTVIPALVARADPNLPVERLRTMDDQIWDNVTPQRVLATLSSWFAALAVLLAAIGLYAMLAYSVAQRLKEIGVRLAIGARPGDVQRMLFAQVGRMIAVGGGIGVAAAFGVSRLVRGLLFGVESGNPILLGAAAAIACVAFSAAVIPAYRASRVNPVLALRAE